MLKFKVDWFSYKKVAKSSSRLTNGVQKLRADNDANTFQTVRGKFIF